MCFLYICGENKILGAQNSDWSHKILYKNQAENLRRIFIRKNRFHRVKPVHE